jgi:malonyl-CoA O-methyltransferase
MSRSDRDTKPRFILSVYRVFFSIRSPHIARARPVLRYDRRIMEGVHSIPPGLEGLENPSLRNLRRVRNRVAQRFDSGLALHGEISDRSVERLQYIKYQPSTILNLGSATGHGTRSLVHRYPHAAIYALDSSLGMQRVAFPKRTWWRGFVSPGPEGVPLCAETNAIPLRDQSIGMVWSNLYLFWFDAKKTVAELRRVLAPGGLIMLSTLGPDTLKELRNAFRSCDGQAHVLGFLDMHDLGDLLLGAGFRDPVVDMETITYTYNALETLLSDLRNAASTNLDPLRARGLLGRESFEQLRHAYEVLRTPAGLPATFEVVYAHAWCGADRPKDKGSRVIRFDRLRTATK